MATLCFCPPLSWVPDEGVVPIRKARDEVVHVGVLGRGFDLLHGGVLTTEADVLDDGGVKKDRLLADNPDDTPKVLQVQLLHRILAYQDL